MTPGTIVRRFTIALTAVALAVTLTACGALDTTIPTLEEQARSAWGELQNHYQRRADLIPNLVETVKGYAAQEREVLNQVSEARARVAQVRVNAATVTDPQTFKAYQEVQNQLSSALSRLLLTIERYPDLKTSAGFLALRSQLEATENRIAVARRDYGEAATAYNNAIGTVPGRWIASIFYPEAKPMESFTAPVGLQRPSSPKS
jgi:LemA protein